MVQGAILSVILAFPVERTLLLKEQSLYDVFAVLSRESGVEIPMYLFTSIVFGTTVYFEVGLNTVETSKFLI